MWWLNAPCNTYEDWLNESFADYSSLMAIREEYGENKFNEFIDRYKENIKNTKPIMNIKRDDPQAYTVLYEKGACLLNKLEEKIGKDEFIKLLKEMRVKNIVSTSEFLSLLEENYGNDMKEYIYELLCS